MMLNVTVTNTTSDGGYLTLYPSGSVPVASNINWAAGQSVANEAIIEVSQSGTIEIANGPEGNVDVILDVVGYLTNSSMSSGGYFNPVTPIRICDTRPGNASACEGEFVGADTSFNLPLASIKMISTTISTNPSSIVVNLTVTDTSSSGWAYITGTGKLNTSNLNWQDNQTQANEATVMLNSSLNVSIYNSSSGADFIIDLMGYYS
jgi:hypothetical protein